MASLMEDVLCPILPEHDSQKKVFLADPSLNPLQVPSYENPLQTIYDRLSAPSDTQARRFVCWWRDTPTP